MRELGGSGKFDASVNGGGGDNVLPEEPLGGRIRGEFVG